MNTDDDITRFSTITTCPRCGRARLAGAAEGLCAQCLLTAGIEPLTQSLSAELPTMSTAGEPVEPGLRLHPGQRWGTYRIGRLLGRGGMGEVHEAEHIDSGRRLALKVLRGRAQSPDERARFLREGQLAASISHPHTVYIFGSEEIDEVPVITMELLPGGTLKDRIVSSGPLPPHEAVTAILDILGGLDAAYAAGILHRDIKPSNCFVNVDGAVKVGDFGLSISTLARDVEGELAGGFQGTPQFAPPEQLRGEPLDVRADIYAVGATLYYLLTGQAPFDARDLRDLIAQVLTTPPASPRRVRPDIPPPLASVVLRCLAKEPRERPASYAELAESLRPFAAHRDTPAAPGVRTLAGVLDSAILTMPVGIATLWIADPANRTQGATATIAAWSWVPAFIYFFWLESQWSASLGKRLLGLRVVSAAGTRANVRQIAARTAMCYAADAMLSALALLVTAGTAVALDTYRTPILLLALGLLFATVRRANGWAAIHDLVSGTRVVAHAPAGLPRRAPTVAVPATLVQAQSRTRHYGPFVAENITAETATAARVAFDPLLRRAIWIRPLAAGTPPIDDARRDVARVGRLRWLTGRRADEESWDAFEAPAGQPFLAYTDGFRWPAVKLWLFDLANELARATADGTLPRLGLDRLWIRTDGRLVLLDFPPPAAAASIALIATAKECDTPGGLLDALVRHTGLVAPASSDANDPMSPAARAERLALPLSARTLLERICNAAPPSLAEINSALSELVKAPDHVARWRRALPPMLAAALVVLAISVSLIATFALTGLMTPANQEVLELLTALRNPSPPAASRMANPEYRLAAEQYVAGRYGRVIATDDFWRSYVMQRLARDLRPTANDILARHPSVSADELARASAIVTPARRPVRPSAKPSPFMQVGGPIIGTLTALALLVGMSLSLLSAAIVPGGVVSRLLGVATLRENGEVISRWRSVARAVVAWSPGILWMAYLATSPRIQGFVPAPPNPLLAAAVTLLVLAAGATWTILRPSRGPHDRLMGTWVVPK